jgi:hypothetical protein
LVPDHATTIMRSALDNTWRDLRRTHGHDAAAIVFRHPISRLDNGHRAHGADLIAASVA